MASEFDRARKNMILGQLAPHGIESSLQHAFEKVPREWFVTPDQAVTVYSDSDTPLLGGSNTRTLLSPIKLARLFQAISQKQKPNVLTIGFGGGYSLALGYEYGLTMHGVEEDEILISLAQDNLRRYFETFHGSASTENFVRYQHGMLKDGLPAYANYDAIVIEGGVEEIPQDLLNQLAQDGELVCIHTREPLGVISVHRSGVITPIAFEMTAPLEAFKAPKTFVL